MNNAARVSLRAGVKLRVYTSDLFELEDSFAPTVAPRVAPEDG